MLDWCAVAECPHCECLHSVERHGGNLRCRDCGGVIVLHADGKMIDLLSPNRDAPSHFCNESVRAYYLAQATSDFSTQPPWRGWGRTDPRAPGHSTFIGMERRLVEERILALPGRKLLLDLSAGAGSWTFQLAQYFETVIHCDLSASALKQAYIDAQTDGLQNIYFARCDYRNVRFRAGIADCVVMIDSLIYYGFLDDQRTLTKAAAWMDSGTLMAFDVHNDRPFPWRRSRNVTYSRCQRLALLNALPPSMHVEAIPLGRLPMMWTRNSLTWRLAEYCRFMPAARTLYLARSSARPPEHA